MIRILFDYFTISAVAANRQLSFGFAALFNFSTPGQMPPVADTDKHIAEKPALS